MEPEESPIVRMAQLRELIRSGQAREIRMRAGVSAGEVARELGIKDFQILSWENGVRTPRVTTASLRYLDILLALAALDSRAGVGPTRAGAGQ